MSADAPLAAFEYESGNLDDVFEFLKRTRSELRTLRKVHVWTDRVQLFDVNGDYFEIAGIGYPDEDVVPLLKSLGTSFKPDFIQINYSLGERAAEDRRFDPHQ